MSEQQVSSASSLTSSAAGGDEVDLDAALAALDKPATIEAVVSVEQIRNMIAQLSVTEEGESLVTAMRDLKKAINDNPDACVTLLPEDIGETVRHLLKMTGKDVADAAARMKKPRAKKSDINLADPKVQQEILDDL